MDRRRAIVFATATASLFAVGRLHGQQTKRIPRVGVLAANEKYLPDFDAFQNELRRLGYIEGRTLSVYWRFPEKSPSQLPTLARELVDLSPDVLVAISTPAVNALRSVAGNIPIVFSNIGDPIASGFVASLARPGGRMTGQSILAPELSAKRLALMKQIIRGASAIAVIWNPTNPANGLQYRQVQETAPSLRIRLISLQVQKGEDLPTALDEAVKEHANMLLVLPDPITGSRRSELIRLAARARIPAMYGYREFPDAGGLMSYGPNLQEMYRRTAAYVDKILKGANPGDLPVEQPATFELVINQRTARALGVTIPKELLLRANEVIE